MNKKYIISIDQGTTSSRVVAVSSKGDVVYKEQIDVNLYESNNIITQNASELVETVKILIDRLFKKNQINPCDVSAISITNQRETTILWDKHTSKPIDMAISWQSKHTQNITDKWLKKGYAQLIYDKTGLELNPYFSASKIKYLLDKNKPNIDNILFGTVDSYLLYCLSDEKNHITDITNAARTMLYNIYDKCWDKTLLELFDIPISILPKVVANDYNFGTYTYNNVKIPILAMIGDQQSSLIGHQCFYKNNIKATYGTGGFLLVNTGTLPVKSKNGLLTTIAYSINNETIYALEGSIFICGAVVQFLRDELKLIQNVDDTEKLAYDSNSDNIYFVPSFVGLGTPYWDNKASATILGIKRKTSTNDIVKAALNGIAYQIEDVLEVIRKEINSDILELSVDGGASKNQYLMQFQSSISNLKVYQTSESELTALGAAYIAGLKSGFFKDISQIERNRKIKKVFYPNIDIEKRKKLYSNWKKAIKAVQLFKID